MTGLRRPTRIPLWLVPATSGRSPRAPRRGRGHQLKTGFRRRVSGCLRLDPATCSRMIDRDLALANDRFQSTAAKTVRPSTFGRLTTTWSIPSPCNVLDHEVRNIPIDPIAPERVQVWGFQPARMPMAGARSLLRSRSEGNQFRTASDSIRSRTSSTLGMLASSSRTEAARAARPVSFKSS
jgi:hypothetical protein